MPTHSGPNPSADNSIVFSYDTGDTSNSYIGEPTVNYYGDIDTSIALRTPSTEYNTSNWTANFPAPPENIGRVYKNTSGALSSTWSGNSYGYTLKSYTYPAGAIYTLSAWVYVSPDCNISQLNVSIEGGGSWIDYNYQYDLNNKGTWQRIWLEINTLGGFAGNAIPIYPQRWGVTDGSFTGFYAWGGVMLEAKDHITQYTVSSRSATQGLLPLISNTSIDLSNVSFDSNAQIVFDGTDDFIDTNFPAITLNTPTIEAVVYRSTNTGRYEAIIQNNVASDDALYVYPQGALGFWPCGVSNLSVPTGQWSYVAVSYDGTNLIYCVNGVTQTIITTCADITDWDFLRIGGFGAGDGERWIGKIAVSKVYNQALTANEFKQNYQQYKSRFNLS
jgi:hypothetical protein